MTIQDTLSIVINGVELYFEFIVETTGYSDTLIEESASFYEVEDIETKILDIEGVPSNLFNDDTLNACKEHVANNINDLILKHN